MQRGTAIPSNADVNDYKTPGNYYCDLNTTAETLTNSPFNVAFTLKVEYATGTAQARQIYTRYDNGNKALRKSNGTEWGPFYYFSDDATVLSNGIARSMVHVQCTANATTVINSDNATVTAGKLPEKRQTYIPVVVGHSSTNACIDSVCYDSSAGWFIYTTYAQYVSIMFYDISKITHVEASS